MDLAVLEIVTRAAPLSESAIGLQMPGVHNEIVAGCLRRLREKQQIERSDAGLWSVKGAPVVATKEPVMVESTTLKCAKCGSTDYTPAGKCRPCKKAHNAKYLAKKTGKALPPPYHRYGQKESETRCRAAAGRSHGDDAVCDPHRRLGRPHPRSFLERRCGQAPRP